MVKTKESKQAHCVFCKLPVNSKSEKSAFAESDLKPFCLALFAMLFNRRGFSEHVNITVERIFNITDMK